MTDKEREHEVERTLQELDELEEGKPIDPTKIDMIKKHFKKNPDLIQKYATPAYGNKKGQKKIRCIALSASKGAMPTLTDKPKNVKYGTKWFSANNGTYFINYDALIDIGKTYLYMTDARNAVGAMYLKEHMEFADANQVEMMVNQHSVEVFKKHKGIPLKLLLIVAIVAMIAVIATMILTQFVIGMNTQNARLIVTNKALTDENTRYHELYGALPPVEVVSK